MPMAHRLRFAPANAAITRRLKSTLPSSPTAAADPSQARMLIGFTCKVCNHRQHKTMSKQAYTKGVVLMQCDQCKNRHLIADHLGWFRNSAVTVQDIMREKGEDVRHLQDIGLLDNIEAEHVHNALASDSDTGSDPNRDHRHHHKPSADLPAPSKD
ncbi:hypothetical protein LPJ53_001102 [Coemansia erecta]|uniref:DNL-type domain-containing protein n=1 Tax=Coemansia erecta TaxID=147472 RepID=A0A9W8CT69_9FUNG|nr:hypothetical protein LPJ53_001102 [Coemansia erecta]